MQLLRQAGRDGVVISIKDAPAVAGAWRFYERFGWHPILREVHGWRRAEKRPKECFAMWV